MIELAHRVCQVVLSSRRVRESKIQRNEALSIRGISKDIQQANPFPFCEKSEVPVPQFLACLVYPGVLFEMPLFTPRKYSIYYLLR